MKIWEGKEWENHIQLLLKRHYGTNYQDVSDEDGGDYGLEGFSLDGCVYQCYAAKEPVTTEELYKNQRNKITRDINKLIKNKEHLLKIFGTLKIKRWILVVPRYKSAKLLIHTEKKSQEVIKEKLPYVTNEFKILVITDDYFKVEQQELKNTVFKVESKGVSQEEIEDWKNESEHLILINNLVNKANKINRLSTTQRSAFIDTTIKYFIKGQILLSQLSDLYPDTYERIISFKSFKEDFIQFGLLTDTDDELKTFQATFFTYKEELEKELDGINPNALAVLSYEAVSDWLMRCPLDF
ncbi:hypothetical protein COF42_03385 [Bacillus wiedmannii]|uniref:hypothetical protein n=1 Tax=Bacillus wiedmannii TaxID=1890302 RepID=UPI000BFC364C|nr:hypothetical protein [Bacillus wiedmannii]PHC91647.1 hypothetical protein COF42_03385 [Bacillus wiedmannii]